MRIGMLMRDMEYRDALTEMISHSDRDILIEIAGRSGADGKSVILTDIMPDEIDDDVLRRIAPRTLFLSSIPPERGTSLNSDDHTDTNTLPLNVIFKYSSVSTILAELTLVYQRWTGDSCILSTVSVTIAVMGESDLHSSSICRMLARQIIYRRGGSVLILPLGFINDYAERNNTQAEREEARGWFRRLIYMIDDGRDFPAESFVTNDSYGISYLKLPEGLNPVAELDSRYLDRLVTSMGMRFDTMILDIGTCYRQENIGLACRADRIIFIGSGRRIRDIREMIDSLPAERTKSIRFSMGTDETLALDDYVLELFRKDSDEGNTHRK